MVFKKGQSGNLKGRPVGAFSLVELLKDRLRSIPEGEKEMVATKAIDAYLKHLKEGKPEILKDAFDRIDGKPKSSDGELGSEKNPFNHNVHYILTKPKEKEV